MQKSWESKRITSVLITIKKTLIITFSRSLKPNKKSSSSWSGKRSTLPSKIYTTYKTSLPKRTWTVFRAESQRSMTSAKLPPKDWARSFCFRQRLTILTCLRLMWLQRESISPHKANPLRKNTIDLYRNTKRQERRRLRQIAKNRLIRTADSRSRMEKEKTTKGLYYFKLWQFSKCCWIYEAA